MGAKKLTLKAVFDGWDLNDNLYPIIKLDYFEGKDTKRLVAVFSCLGEYDLLRIMNRARKVGGGVLIKGVQSVNFPLVEVTIFTVNE